jgi:hypothetical protein
VVVVLVVPVVGCGALDCWGADIEEVLFVTMDLPLHHNITRKSALIDGYYETGREWRSSIKECLKNVRRITCFAEVRAGRASSGLRFVSVDTSYLR